MRLLSCLPEKSSNVIGIKRCDRKALLWMDCSQDWRAMDLSRVRFEMELLNAISHVIVQNEDARHGQEHPSVRGIFLEELVGKIGVWIFGNARNLILGAASGDTFQSVGLKGLQIALRKRVR